MQSFSKTNKNAWMFLIIMLAGLTVGGAIGSLCEGIPYLAWLNYGQTFGLEQPVNIDLGVLWFSVQLVVEFTISGIIGMALAIFVYRKL